MSRAGWVAGLTWAMVVIPCLVIAQMGKLSEILSATDGQPLIAKFTYVGPQDHPVPSLLLHDSRLPEANDFLDRFSPAKEIHANDVIASLQHVSVRESALRQLIAEVGTVAAESRAKSAADAKVVLAVARGSDTKVGVQVFLDRASTRKALAVIRRHMTADARGLQRVDNFRTHLGYVSIDR